MGKIREMFILTLQSRIERLQHISDTPVLLGKNTLIRISPGLYLRVQGGEFSVSGFEFASYWSAEDAADGCRNDNVRDGAGNVGVPINWRDALRDEIAQDQELLATMQRQAQ